MHKFISSILILACLTAHAQSAKPPIGELPPFTKWYQNPLGVSPIALHTGNGLWIPAVAATAVLLFTHKDTATVKRFVFFNESGISKGYYGSRTSVFQNNSGVLFYVRNWMALGGEFTTYHMRDAINDTWGFGLRPFVRFYAVRRNRFNIYFESGAGLIRFMDEYPQPSGFFGDNRKGTYLNGSPKYGVGGEIKLEQSLTLFVGARHVHISNGDHPGYDRNPGHDSNGFNVGFLYTPQQ